MLENVGVHVRKPEDRQGGGGGGQDEPPGARAQRWPRSPRWRRSCRRSRRGGSRRACPAGAAKAILPSWRLPCGKATQPGHGCHSAAPVDRKSTRLNSSHRTISNAVFCFKKKKK